MGDGMGWVGLGWAGRGGGEGGRLIFSAGVMI